jgi:hypothetical protein
VSTPSPADRLAGRLAHLPPDGIRALDGSLDRAEARARATGRRVVVAVEFEVGPDGLEALELPERFERRMAEKGA